MVAIENSPKKTAQKDAYKTVPLFAPVATKLKIKSGAKPELSYRGGPLIQNVEVFLVFWGTQWQDSKLADESKKIIQFFQFIVKSKLIDQLSEYNVKDKLIGHGSVIGSMVMNSPPVSIVTTDSALQMLIKEKIKSKEFPQPNENTLYFIYTPPGVGIKMGGGASCHAFCGYHDSIDEKIFYAIMPYANCSGCLGDLSEFDALTSTSTHELCEAITDPVPGQGWYDDIHGEIGDICAWTTKDLGGYKVQLEWSNKEKKCI